MNDLGFEEPVDRLLPSLIRSITRLQSSGYLISLRSRARRSAVISWAAAPK
jgi:hypothetical protein